MDRDFIAEARKADKPTRSIAALEVLRLDPTVKGRHLRKALNITGRQFRKADRLARMLKDYDRTTK